MGKQANIFFLGAPIALKGIFLMGKKLYVGNLSYTTTEDDLRKLFTEIGPVSSVAIITDRMTGKSKGFGFVEMETEQTAQEAIERLNNQEFNQRKIMVSEARPPRERTGGGGGGGGYRSDRGGGGRDRDRRGSGDRGDRSDRGERRRY